MSFATLELEKSFFLSKTLHLTLKTEELVLKQRVLHFRQKDPGKRTVMMRRRGKMLLLFFE